LVHAYNSRRSEVQGSPRIARHKACCSASGRSSNTSGRARHQYQRLSRNIAGHRLGHAAVRSASVRPHPTGVAHNRRRLNEGGPSLTRQAPISFVALNPHRLPAPRFELIPVKEPVYQAGPLLYPNDDPKGMAPSYVIAIARPHYSTRQIPACHQILPRPGLSHAASVPASMSEP
jgi:hypothetical protein